MFQTQARTFSFLRVFESKPLFNRHTFSIDDGYSFIGSLNFNVLGKKGNVYISKPGFK